MSDPPPPPIPPPVPPTVPPTVPPPSALSVFVLVADDEPMILELIELALEGGGFTAVLSSSGAEALTHLQDDRRPIQALITDIRMGDGPDGWELARRARELNPRLPVLYMSGDSAAEWSAQGVPGSLMLQKPFAPAQIVTAVASLINHAEL